MNYSQQQADPKKHLLGISAVILFHVLVVYALVTGLAKKVIDVVRAPIETKVIEEIKKPPPPPEVVVPPPPKPGDDAPDDASAEGDEGDAPVGGGSGASPEPVR